MQCSVVQCKVMCKYSAYLISLEDSRSVWMSSLARSDSLTTYTHVRGERERRDNTHTCTQTEQNYKCAIDNRQ